MGGAKKGKDEDSWKKIVVQFTAITHSLVVLTIFLAITEQDNYDMYNFPIPN